MRIDCGEGQVRGLWMRTIKVKVDDLTLKKIDWIKKEFKCANTDEAINIAIMFATGLLQELDGTNKIGIINADGKAQEIRFNFYCVEKGH